MGHTPPPPPSTRYFLSSAQPWWVYLSISDVSPPVQKKPATVDGTRGGGQVRKRTVPLLGVPSKASHLVQWARLEPWLFQSLSLAGEGAPMIGLIQP